MPLVSAEDLRVDKIFN